MCKVKQKLGGKVGEIQQFTAMSSSSLTETFDIAGICWCVILTNDRCQQFTAMSRSSLTETFDIAGICWISISYIYITDEISNFLGKSNYCSNLNLILYI
jgi:hypothetical protein